MIQIVRVSSGFQNTDSSPLYWKNIDSLNTQVRAELYYSCIQMKVFTKASSRIHTCIYRVGASSNLLTFDTTYRAVQCLLYVHQTLTLFSKIPS